ncbi:MAG: single-stranded DNA-binding protein [Bacilli bacterium]|nr:single-stranded DNA-binding protein [Bacilli bacterium]MDD4388595.1 single-stranded DNA-binding protein [Bacilli bacterium]
MNKVILVGRLTKDPELKRTNNDIPFVMFTVAINRIYANKQGEKQTDFINCVAWRNQAENLARYMRKGSLVGVDGQLQSRSYDDANGIRRYVTEVVSDNIHFLEPKSARSDTSSGYSDISQYEIPDDYRRYENDYYDREKDKNETKNPFEDIKSDFNVSNDDLPF